MVDECHLLWGDVCGYVWGKTSERVEVPIVNERKKQTYFGALDYKTKEFLTSAADTANSQTTVEFLKYLQLQRPGAKLLIIWDGASYHRSQLLKDYLNIVNHGLEELQWSITCKRFAPNAPEQNPVEDIWLQAKKMIREFYFLCHSFSVVKKLFEFCVHRQIFDFPKLHKYGVFSEIIPELLI